MFKSLSFLIILFNFSSVFSQDKIFNLKSLSNFFMDPNIESSIIYPVEMGKELSLKNSEDKWFQGLDQTTGLVGWVLKEDFGYTKPESKFVGKDYSENFKIFKGRVLEMSKSIKEAISIDTFLDVKHLGGAAAIVIADKNWFNGRRHANQAFQVYELWSNQNQSPSFLSFRNNENEEKFIILSGPHRPRYLKSTKK